MGHELQVKRLAKRLMGKGGDAEDISEDAIQKAKDLFTKLKHTQGYQRMEENEPNSITIDIDETMDVDEVTRQILERVKCI